jgi:hypothetical protein
MGLAAGDLKTGVPTLRRAKALEKLGIDMSRKLSIPA